MATFQTAGYPVPPAAFASFKSWTPPQTPPTSSSSYAYYSPRNPIYTSTPSKGHARRATGDAPVNCSSSTAYTTTFPSPRKSAQYSTPDYGYFASAQSTPQRKTDYVSGSERQRERARSYYTAPAEGYGSGSGKSYQFSSSNPHYSSRSHQYVDSNDYYDRSYEYLPRYEQYEARPPPYHQGRHEYRADHSRFYDQVPIYTPAEPSTERHGHRRRASYAAKTTSSSQRPRPSTATKPANKATEEDARRAGIPAGYSFKNWDPAEEPILLLGSVFDANSLGKWIYDWTVFYYGPSTPMSEMAGDLWLLLIKLAYKVKRAEECLSSIRSPTNRDLIEDFLDSGERLWQRFNKLLKICENYMWKVAKRENGNAKNITMGQNSGCEFVDAIFGRDRELERTEKLMVGIRLWSMRFDANCEEILSNPSA